MQGSFATVLVGRFPASQCRKPCAPYGVFKPVRRRVPRRLRLQPLYVPPQAGGTYEAAQERQAGRGRAQADAEHVQAHQHRLPGPRALLARHALRRTGVRELTRGIFSGYRERRDERSFLGLNASNQRYRASRLVPGLNRFQRK